MLEADKIESFIAEWRGTGGSELANTQSFINGLARLLGVDPPRGAKADDTANDYVFERRVFQDNGDGTTSFGRIDCYKRGCFILEAKQGSEADRAAADKGEDDLDIFGQTAKTRVARGTARRGTPGWAKAMVQAKGQAERYAKALPIDHGWPPFLLVADIGYCIEVYPGQVRLALLEPVLSTLLYETTEVCSADCKRVICGGGDAYAFDNEPIEAYWRRLDPQGRQAGPAKDDRQFWIEKNDAPCKVGFAVGPGNGCPLFASEPGETDLAELLAIVERVSDFRSAEAKAKAAAGAAPGQP